jgi:hypothetical protein
MPQQVRLVIPGAWPVSVCQGKTFQIRAYISPGANACVYIFKSSVVLCCARVSVLHVDGRENTQWKFFLKGG